MSLQINCMGYVFDKWTGATGNAKTTLVIDGDKTVVGNFVRIQFELTVTITGEGTVAQKVIKAGGATKYNSGTIVELTATPKAGWIFKEWSGSLIGTTNPQQITLDKAKSVTATFIEKDKDDFIRYDMFTHGKDREKWIKEIENNL